MDFFNHFEFDTNGGSKVKTDGSGVRLNSRRNSKKDDDTQTTFFYSQSEATSTGLKLAGEAITLGSKTPSLMSFDHIDSTKMGKEQRAERRRDDTTYQLGMGRREYHMREEQPPPREYHMREEQPPPRRPSAKRKNSQQPTKKAPPSPPRRPSRKPRHRSSKYLEKDDSWSSIDSGKNGCAAPEIVEEMVEDVKSVLTQVISTVYMACSESDQCLSKCHNSPKPNKKLSSIDEEELAPQFAPQVQESSSSFVVKEEPTGCKPWAGCLHPSPTEETEASAVSQEVVKCTEKKKRPPRIVRLRRFLTSPLKRK